MAATSQDQTVQDQKPQAPKEPLSPAQKTLEELSSGAKIPTETNPNPNPNPSYLISELLSQIGDDEQHDMLRSICGILNAFTLAKQRVYGTPLWVERDLQAFSDAVRSLYSIRPK